MLKRYLLMGVFAASCAGAAVAAQTPAPNPPQQQPPATETPQRPPAPTEPEATRPAAQGTTATLSGCVYREADVAGRTPNVAERAGILEDYILADVKTSADQTAPSASPTPGAVGTSGTTAAMYKLEKIEDDRLRELVGKRVEVTGRIDAEAGDRTAAPTPQPDSNLGPDRIELPEFEVASIRELAGGAACPASPASRK